LQTNFIRQSRWWIDFTGTIVNYFAVMCIAWSAASIYPRFIAALQDLAEAPKLSQVSFAGLFIKCSMLFPGVFGLVDAIMRMVTITRGSDDCLVKCFCSGLLGPLQLVCAGLSIPVTQLTSTSNLSAREADCQGRACALLMFLALHARQVGLMSKLLPKQEMNDLLVLKGGDHINMVSRGSHSAKPWCIGKSCWCLSAKFMDNPKDVGAFADGNKEFAAMYLKDEVQLSKVFLDQTPDYDHSEEANAKWHEFLYTNWIQVHEEDKREDLE